MAYMGMDAFGRCTMCGSPGINTAGKCYQCGQSQKTPYICPTCNGTGKVSRPPWLAGDVDCWSSDKAGELYECGSCEGKGILWQ